MNAQPLAFFANEPEPGTPDRKPFLDTLAIPYRFSEYRLELDRSAIDRSRPRHDTLTLRPATEADTDARQKQQRAAGNYTLAQALGSWQWYGLWAILFLNVTAGIAIISSWTSTRPAPAPRTT